MSRSNCKSGVRMGALVSAGALLLSVGCGRDAASPSGPEASQSTPAVIVEEEGPVAEESAASPDMDAESESTAAAPTSAATPESSTASPDATEQPAAGLPTKVTLGDPSLTAGIPGVGELTIEQIQAWLATPGVHEVLEVELPLGLSLGANAIVGLDTNPLTRAKIELGRQLYFDTRLSADNTVSCATCHDPDQGYTAHTQFGVGIGGQTGNRNSPVAYNRILSGPQFWDGRAASLEEQAQGPIANPIEMGNTHEAAVASVAAVEGYQVQFDAIFGSNSVNINNIAAAIAAYERALVSGPSPYDYYAGLKPFLDLSDDDLAEIQSDDPELYERYQTLKAGFDANPMSESAIRGQQLFFSEKANCTACHAGANFTDEKYHNIGVGMASEQPDRGRAEISGNEAETGAFKTPTVRNAALSAPYMHDGSQATLQEVVEWYAKGGHPNPHLSDKMKKLELSEQDKADLVAFMEALTGEFAEVERGRLPQ